MRNLVVHLWCLVMDHRKNPLKNIPDLQTRHVILQLLAWMWCIIFSMSVTSITLFGLAAVAHALVISGVVVTVATFDQARNKPGNLVID